MNSLTPEQNRYAIELLHEYLNARLDDEGLAPKERMGRVDRDRVNLIEDTLRPLLDSYLSGETELEEFKTKIDGINKRNELWGFKGIKGQMFFNMLTNVATTMEECNAELKAAITEPTSDDMAKSRIRTFVSYVTRLGDQFVDAGGSKHGRPKVGSIPFFLSYFWQIQNRITWPVYYTNSVQTLTDANLWTPKDELAEDYIDYKRVHLELADLFSQEANRPMSLYDVEHVFWVKGGNPYGKTKPAPVDKNGSKVSPQPPIQPLPINRLPDSFVPPIVAVLPRLAAGGDEMDQAASASGVSVARAFEKSVHAAFTILGYETKLLGQGSGRTPDGLALNFDDSYAIIWDSKSRTSGYSMGTDDRIIREYVSVQSRELTRRRMLRNIYYVIVSSCFKDDAEDTIRMMKMETDVSEICLMEADALVAIVDAKLREPIQITLGPDGLQRLFVNSGVLTAEQVHQLLG